MLDTILRLIDDVLKRLGRLETQEHLRFVPLTTLLTAPGVWEGQARSSTGATTIDLSAVFGVPAYVKAALITVFVQDSGSLAGGDVRVQFGPAGGVSEAVTVRCGGIADSNWVGGGGIVPCDAAGDINYYINASGANTMLVYLRVWGYWL